ncbi:general secretion pathway protein GspB [Vibrio sp. WXL210]|uniref:general secretion pathway protein GspB n=1 Tax=Vibrio sp. WXL210 TaxID=3450709 RepID=UPI003EC69705
MSKVLSALQSSEQQHYAQSQPMMGGAPMVVRPQPAPLSWGKLMLLALLPSLTVGSYFIAKAYRAELTQEPELVVETQVEYIDVDYQLTSISPSSNLPAVPRRGLGDANGFGDASNFDDVIATTPQATPQVSSNITNNADNPFGDLDLSELSPELAQRVQQAITAPSTQAPSARTSERSNAIALQQNAADYLGRLPALNFQTHVYSSAVDKRWVKINDVEYSQGEVIGAELILEEIEPQACVIRFQGERIRVPALYDWRG